MKITQRILNIAKKNNGFITSSMAVSMKISRGHLKYLVERELLEKTSRGVYILPEVFDDELFNIQYQFAKGIYSLGTALFLNDLSDVSPLKYSMSFPTNYNLTNVKAAGIYGYRDRFYDYGSIILKTPNGNKVKVYCAERTLCDLLRFKERIDTQVFSDAFKFYFRDNYNISKLIEFAKILKVKPKLMPYLEVLL